MEAIFDGDASRTKPLSDRDITNDAAGRPPDGEYLHTISACVRPAPELTSVRFEGDRSVLPSPLEALVTKNAPAKF